MAYRRFKRGEWRKHTNVVMPVERDGLYPGQLSPCPFDLRAQGQTMTRVRPGRVARSATENPFRNDFHRSVWLFGEWDVEPPVKPAKVSERAPRSVFTLKNVRLTFPDVMTRQQAGATRLCVYPGDKYVFDGGSGLVRMNFRDITINVRGATLLHRASVERRHEVIAAYRRDREAARQAEWNGRIRYRPEEWKVVDVAPSYRSPRETGLDEMRAYCLADVLIECGKSDTSRYIGGLRIPTIFPSPCNEEIMTESDLKILFNNGSNPAIPAFVEPERPSEPAPPVDTPSAAALRPLLADRERIEKIALDRVAGHERNIADHEARIASLKADRDHAQAIAEKAETEITQIRGDIARLNGDDGRVPGAAAINEAAR